MTGQAGELGVIDIGGMAIRTLCPFPLMRAAVDFEILSVMIECRWEPCGRRVARGAIMTEISRNMIGACWNLIVCLMTLVAV